MINREKLQKALELLEAATDEIINANDTCDENCNNCILKNSCEKFDDIVNYLNIDLRKTINIIYGEILKV